METLRRLAGRAVSKKEDDTPLAGATDGPKPADDPKAPAATATAAAGSEEEEVPRSPLTGRPLSPRAQAMREAELRLLEEGPRLL